MTMVPPTLSTALDQITELLSLHGYGGFASALAALVQELLALEPDPGPGLDGSPGLMHDGAEAWSRDLHGDSRSAWPVPPAGAWPPPRGHGPASKLETGTRSERALKLVLAEMAVLGIATPRGSALAGQHCGLPLTSDQVGRSAAALDQELDAWRNRSLTATPYLILDTCAGHMRRDGQVVPWVCLVAAGIDAHGKRSILGVSPQRPGPEPSWHEFLGRLQARGLYGVKLVVSACRTDLASALDAHLPGVAWQRCQADLIRLAQRVAARLAIRPTVAPTLRAVFDAPDRREAQRRLDRVLAGDCGSHPKLAAWLASHIHEGLAVFGVPAGHRRRLRTTHLLERLHRDLKRPTRVAGLFPSEAAAQRLVSALAMEISEQWETGRAYLLMEPI